MQRVPMTSDTPANVTGLAVKGERIWFWQTIGVLELNAHSPRFEARLELCENFVGPSVADRVRLPDRLARFDHIFIGRDKEGCYRTRPKSVSPPLIPNGLRKVENFPLIPPLLGVVGGHSSIGRAPALQAGGQGFESPCLHHSGGGCERGVRCAPGLPAQDILPHATRRS